MGSLIWTVEIGVVRSAQAWFFPQGAHPGLDAGAALSMAALTAEQRSSRGLYALLAGFAWVAV
ncbi:MAG: hypothetical protein M0Q98_04970 [Pseudomonas sp.]|jgi:hypothetical protein|nr:hypothetical protein [Pseudomonas sp.]MDD2222669.1 hypothetical protein [Pseudomonas sp.]MDY0413748.1 hypothetical protein [Pseudomonas sp.]NLO53591.1 hypothetical protein [Gammaproteobacteria bacterium]